MKTRLETAIGWTIGQCNEDLYDTYVGDKEYLFWLNDVELITFWLLVLESEA